MASKEDFEFLSSEYQFLSRVRVPLLKASCDSKFAFSIPLSQRQITGRNTICPFVMDSYSHPVIGNVFVGVQRLKCESEHFFLSIAEVCLIFILIALFKYLYF